MLDRERRGEAAAALAAGRAQLNAVQKETLDGLERFGWELKFVRRPLFLDPLPVVFDSDRKRYALLNPDGTLDDNPGFDIRM
jgi:hypothetical protein